MSEPSPEELPDYVQCEHCGKCTPLKLDHQQPSAEQIVDALSGGCATVGRDKAIAIVRACLNQHPSPPTPEEYADAGRLTNPGTPAPTPEVEQMIAKWAPVLRRNITAMEKHDIEQFAAQARKPLVKAIQNAIDEFMKGNWTTVLGVLRTALTGTGETPS